MLIAWKGLALIVAWIPTNSFAAESVIEMNLPVLLVSTALAVVTALVFGVWPALQLSRPDLARVTQASARRVIGSAQGRRTHRVMVAVQVALTLLMLTVAGAAGKGFLRLANADLGYDPQNTMSLPIPVHDGTYKTWKERSEYFERLRAAVAAMPQVESAGISTNATPPAERRRHHDRDSRRRRAGEAGRARELRQLRVLPAAAHPGGAGPPLERRRDRARRAARRDQPDDGAAVLAEGRRRGTAVPVREHEGRAAVLADGGRRRRLDRDRSASSPMRATTGCAIPSGRRSTCPTR